MSNNENTIFLEKSWEVFNGALETDDFALAQNVIQDLLDNGFSEEAFDLADRLQKSDLYQRYEVAPKIV